MNASPNEGFFSFENGISYRYIIYRIRYKIISSEIEFTNFILYHRDFAAIQSKYLSTSKKFSSMFFEEGICIYESLLNVYKKWRSIGLLVLYKCI